MAISRSDMERQLRNMGGRIGFQEGGGIEQRLEQLGGDVTSAEQMLQGINQRLKSAESSLGSGGAMQQPVGGLAEIANNLNTFPGNPNRRPIAEPNNIGTLGQPLFDKDGFRLGDQRYGTGLVGGPQRALPGSIQNLQNQQDVVDLEQLYPNVGPKKIDPFPMRGGAEMMELAGIPAAGYADGGLASLQDPRQGYFLGKLVRKAKKAVKKVVKSPIGKAAILGGLTFGVPGTGFKGFLGAGKGGGLGSFIKNKLLGTGALGDFGATGSKGLLRSLGLTKGGYGSFGGLTGLGKIAGIGAASGLAGLLAAREQEDEEGFDISKVDRGEGLDIDRIVRLARMNDPQFRFLPGAEFTTAFAEGGGVGSLAMNEEGVKQKFVSDEAGAIPKKMKDGEGGVLPSDMGKLKRSDFETEEDYQRYLRQLNRKAEGGLMNLGGMEMDLRGGGFVPIGAKEKADDVPARLSKNEFVMTADAVRAAGGGSVDKGADKMYKMMKNLEAQV